MPNFQRIGEKKTETPKRVDFRERPSIEKHTYTRTLGLRGQVKTENFLRKKIKGKVNLDQPKKSGQTDIREVKFRQLTRKKDALET